MFLESKHFNKILEESNLNFEIHLKGDFNLKI